jgi:DNA replication and repair protein RecF
LDAVVPWTASVVTLGEALVGARLDVIQLLSHAFAETAGELGLDEATIAYDGEPVSAEELDARVGIDLERGATGAGPHLHDVRLEAEGRDVRAFGSQGEQRVAVLALVLAEAAVLRERHDLSPLVLLDDVLSELDGERRRALASMIKRGSQTVVTATATAALPVEPAQSLAVTPGVVR